MARKKLTDPFLALARDDLDDWFGEKVAGRGASYQRSGNVQSLARTSDGGLIAWVMGTRKYATRVDMDDGELSCSRTCPYPGFCKHAAALILAYQQQTEAGHTVPAATPRDRRLALLELEDDLEEEGEDENEEDEASDSSRSHPRMDYLEQQSKAELVALLRELAGRLPAVRTALRDRQRLAGGGAGKLVKELRREIHQLGSQPAWHDHWGGQGYTPDYGRVRDGLEALLARGRADDVLLLGKDLLDEGLTQIEMSDDEGECGAEIGSCLEIAIRALPASSLKPAEQLLWAVEVDMEDQWDYFSAAQDFLDRRHPALAWSRLADALLQRLEDDAPAGEDDGWSGRYRRDRLVDHIVGALKKAGREDEVVPHCEREARANQNYARLVQELIVAGRNDEAEEWIRRGAEKVGQKWPGIASQLYGNLRQIQEQRQDWPAAAALCAQEFFHQPALQTFEDLREVAEKAEGWPAVRAWALHLLATGERPGPFSPQQATDLPAWPLPEPAAKPVGQGWARQFPQVPVLIDIAIAEKDPDEVLRWYDQACSPRGIGFGEVYAEQIAEAVVKSHPQRAAAIWQDLAEVEIQRTSRRGYEAAIVALRKAGRVLHKLGQNAEWRHFLTGLRERYRAKRTFIELLDALKD